jgi:putative FmdB family regulatory protein
MPTYEYKCKACGHLFEEYQSITAPLLKKCPSCGKSKLERLFGIGAAVVFKGGGFYQTDYRSESYTKAAAADKKAASESAPTSPSSSAPSSESKSAGTAGTPSGEGASSTKSSAPESKPSAPTSAPADKAKSTAKRATKPSSAKRK